VDGPPSDGPRGRWKSFRSGKAPAGTFTLPPFRRQHAQESFPNSSPAPRGCSLPRHPTGLPGHDRGPRRPLPNSWPSSDRGSASTISGKSLWGTVYDPATRRLVPRAGSSLEGRPAARVPAREPVALVVLRPGSAPGCGAPSTRLSPQLSRCTGRWQAHPRVGGKSVSPPRHRHLLLLTEECQLQYCVPVFCLAC